MLQFFSDFSRVVLIMPLAYAFHVLEESFGFPQWVSKNFTITFTTSQFRRNNLLFFAISIFIALIVYKLPRKFMVFIFLSWVAGLFFHNALFHIGTTVYFQNYSPGLISSIIIYVPLSLIYYKLVSSEGVLTKFEIIFSFILGGIIHYFFIFIDLFSWNLFA